MAKSLMGTFESYPAIKDHSDYYSNQPLTLNMSFQRDIRIARLSNFVRPNIAVGCLLTLLISNIGFGMENTEWTYFNPLHSNLNLTIQDTDPPSVGYADVRLTAKKCSDDSKFICIETREFEFSIPRIPANVHDKWNNNGWTYEVLKKNHMLVFEEVLEVLVIRKKRGKDIWLFGYSGDRGLVVIENHSYGYGVMYILRGRCGYAASDKCF